MQTARTSDVDPLDTADRRLLDVMQSEVPLTARPFESLGRRVGMDEAACLQRVERLRHDAGMIRQISAIFDTRSLGYASSLIGARIDPQRLEAAAMIISGHPGVSHNYQREHELNLWFTLAVPPDSRLGLEGTVQRLQALSGAERMLLLPTLKLYKIGVRFDLTSRDQKPERERPSAYSEQDARTGRGHTLDAHQRELVRVLQQDLSIEPRPFDAWAKQAGCSVPELLAGAEQLRQRRQMRRFSAVLRHRKVGMQANVMVVWAAPEDEADAVGQRLAQFDEVSHCYLRPTYPDWPYNIYTMVHARSADAVDQTLQRMSKAGGVAVGQTLWSGREFKKQRVRYFTGEIERWEAEHGG